MPHNDLIYDSWKSFGDRMGWHLIECYGSSAARFHDDDMCFDVSRILREKFEEILDRYESPTYIQQ